MTGRKRLMGPHEAPSANGGGGDGDDGLHRYHHDLFGRIADWPTTHEAIIDLTGDSRRKGLIGIDQLGHFGPHGADRVVEEVLAARDAGDAITVLELGSGLGGVIRHVAAGLAAQGLDVRAAVGLELMIEFARTASEIARSTHSPWNTFAVGDVGAMPVAKSSFDVTVVCGSAAHFIRWIEVLRECLRILRPGGLLVVVEEVSLIDPSQELSADFLRAHPRPVFRYDTVKNRLAQFEQAGFEVCRSTDLTGWAAELLAARLKALRLLHGTVVGIYGRQEVALLEATLETSLTAVATRAVTPHLFVARPCDAIRQ